MGVAGHVIQKKACSVKVQSGSGLKHSGLRLKDTRKNKIKA